jgi:hypothetical protein
MRNWNEEAYKPLFMQGKDSWQIIKVIGSQFLFFSLFFQYQWIRRFFTKEWFSGAFFIQLLTLFVLVIYEFMCVNELLNSWLFFIGLSFCGLLVTKTAFSMHRRAEVINV